MISNIKKCKWFTAQLLELLSGLKKFVSSQIDKNKLHFYTLAINRILNLKTVYNPIKKADIPE